MQQLEKTNSLIKLFYYQEKVLEAIDLDSCHSQLISMPTGTGKTITFLSIAYRKNKNCLILVHREELLQQTYEKAKICGFKDEEISIIRSSRKDDLRKLNIAMVQTLARNLNKYSADLIEMMIVDEAHHSTAPSYREIFSHFKIFEEKKLLLGFTATPLRGDKQLLSDLYFSHSFKMTLSEATQNGYICPVHGMRVDIDRSLENIENSQGDYDISELDKVMNCPAINNLVAERCEHLTKVPAIVFCTSVDHAKNIAQLLRNKKRKAISVSYLTPKKTLDRIYKFLKEKRIDFITNAIKLSEGFDYPPIQSIILVRPTRSPVLYKQMIGRGLRKSPDKHDCFVLEFTGNDKNMICWEDIDENCTFQSTPANAKKTREEAFNFYSNRLRSADIKILDVRISPFQFYECRIRRIEKYKKYFYCPHEMGFSLFEVMQTKSRNGDSGFNLFGWEVWWEKTYKFFRLFGEGAYLYFDPWGHPTHELKPLLNWYAARQGGGLGKWYPSEEEPMTLKQKAFLGINQKLSARKAEMMIEDKAIKNSIEKYWINGKPTGIMKVTLW